MVEYGLKIEKGGADGEMSNFVDEYSRVLDEKGRFVLPSRVREKLSGTVFITRSPSDRCLHIYNEREWEGMAERLRELPTTTDKNAAAFVRMFFGKATSSPVDKQGRISIASRLMEYAELKKDIMLIGANTRLEIWDIEIWDRYQDELSEDIVMDGILQYGLKI